MHDMPGTTLRRHRHGGGDGRRPRVLHRHRWPASPVQDRPGHRAARTLRPLEWAHVAILVIDARTIGASHQDQRLAERIGALGCPAIVALNKWDQVPTEERDDVLAGRGRPPRFLGRWTRAQDVSARQGGTQDPPGSSRLRRGVSSAVPDRNPDLVWCRSCRPRARPRARIRYIVQGAIDPPTFTLFTNGRLPKHVSPLHRTRRDKFDFGATPMKLRIGGK